MVTQRTPQRRLTATETQEPDRTWFARRPARKTRMRLPATHEIKRYGKKELTHVIVVRQPKNRLSKTPVNLVGRDSSYVQTMNDLADRYDDGLLDLELAGLAREAAC